MRHVIFGGDGFVGRHLAPRLLAEGHEVVVADLVRSELAHYAVIRHVTIDITSPKSIASLGLRSDDMIYNLCAKMLSPILPRAQRRDACFGVNYDGTNNILAAMDDVGAKTLVHFTTDMVYGHSVTNPAREDHPIAPLGPYGLSKWKSEELVAEWRKRGMNITIFRPRLIIGPGRLGILGKLFRLIDAGLPVPMIGAGHNPYQFVSVFDCADAAIAAFRCGIPNEAFNLGSIDPPPVRLLLGNLIQHAGSRSILLPTPGWAVKRVLDLLDVLNRPLMDPEQYLIADELRVLDVSRSRKRLGWTPQFRDEDMLMAAYDEYRVARSPDAVFSVGRSESRVSPTARGA